MAELKFLGFAGSLRRARTPWLYSGVATRTRQPRRWPPFYNQDVEDAGEPAPVPA